MKPIEREMINEINLARYHPEVYVAYLKDYLDHAKDDSRIPEMNRKITHYPLNIKPLMEELKLPLIPFGSTKMKRKSRPLKA